MARNVRRGLWLAFLIAGVPLAGCSSADLLPGRSQAGWYARNAGWAYEAVGSGPFVLTTALSPSPVGGGVLAVYLEGDGRAFSGDRIVSRDPTPATPTALRMALAHPGAAAWIARPCQYTRPETARGCHAAYWTSHRYAPEVIESTVQAIDDLKRRSGARSVVLVGYSGGGAVAALVAARRSDVVGFVTVAANLDIGYWVARDHLAPLSGSLDPAAEADRLRAVPQVHLAGGRDEVVTPDVARSYLSRLGSEAPARLIDLADFDHWCCWVEAWPRLVQRPEMSTIPEWP